MKKILYILIAIIATSCDYTDIKPKGESLPTDAQALLMLLNKRYQNYMPSGSFYLNPYLKAPKGAKIGGSEDVVSDRIYNFEDMHYEPNKTDFQLDNVWAQINVMNLILDNVEESNATPFEKEFLTSSALMRRAFSHYTMVNLYCPQYTPENGDVPELGWIDKYTEDYNADLTRMTLNETYGKIIADLEKAAAIELARQERTFYGSTDGANALLGMVHMTMGNYDKALTNINKALSLYDYVHDYTAETKDTYPATRAYVDSYTDGEIYMCRKVYVQMNYWQGYDNYAYVSDEFIDLFEENDVRSFGIIDNGESGTDAEGNPTYYKKWAGCKDGYNMHCDVPLMMLYKAEILARKDQITDAMDLVNELRAKRFVPGSDYELTATDKADALQKIYEEFNREFAFTGHVLANIKRLNALHNANISIIRTHTYDETPINVPANDNKWTMIIPEYYINLNTEIKQNPL
jgi:tetratricopeptide (TPR) repeat protein